MLPLDEQDLTRARSAAWLSFMAEVKALPMGHVVSVEQWMNFMATHLQQRLGDITRTRALQGANR